MDDIEIRFRCLELAVKAHAANVDLDIVSFAESFYVFTSYKGSASQGVEDDEIPF
jgi:hypothetical protein